MFPIRFPIVSSVFSVVIEANHRWYDPNKSLQIHHFSGNPNQKVLTLNKILPCLFHFTHMDYCGQWSFALSPALLLFNSSVLVGKH
jgi:hypothetical protein